jgi:UDP-glucose 4-epimerase
VCLSPTAPAISEVTRFVRKPAKPLSSSTTGFSAYLPEGVALFIGDAANENLVEGVIAAHAVESIMHFAAP